MTIHELHRRLRSAWCAETRSTLCDGTFDLKCPSIGQCVPTALIVQDLFGGIILKVWANTAGAHYFNRLPDGTEVDLTKDQFPRGTSYSEPIPFPRREMLDSRAALDGHVRQQYNLLRRNLRLTKRTPHKGA